MRWFTILGAIALGAVLLGFAGFSTMSASPASANGGPHGNFTLTTSGCAGCHRAHTAVGEMLLKAESIYALCITCHSGLAQTDVVHGVQTGGSGLPLNGGGFEQANGESVTSSHTVDGLVVNGTPSSGVGTAWGSQDGVGDGGVGVSGTLECTSCHNPHGSTNYRILNDAGGGNSAKWVNDTDILAFVSYQVQATRDDVFLGNKLYAYDVTDTASCPPLTVAAGAATPTPGPSTKCLARYTSGVQSVTGQPSIIDPLYGMNSFCATCHKSYLTRSGAYNWNSLNTPEDPALIPAVVYPGLQDAQDGHGLVPRFRHSVGRTKGSPPLLPMKFAARGNDPNPAGALTYDAMGCLTCHFAHGTNAAATPAPGDSVMPGPAQDSALLVYDNRGVCVSCHGADFGVVGVTSPVPTNTKAATTTPVPTFTRTPTQTATTVPP